MRKLLLSIIFCAVPLNAATQTLPFTLVDYVNSITYELFDDEDRFNQVLSSLLVSSVENFGQLPDAQEAFLLLLERGADPDGEDECGSTIWDAAQKNGTENLLHYLLVQGGYLDQ